MIFVPVFFSASVRGQLSRVKADQRSLATALEAYYVDNDMLFPFPVFISVFHIKPGHPELGQRKSEKNVN